MPGGIDSPEVELAVGIRVKQRIIADQKDEERNGEADPAAQVSAAEKAGSGHRREVGGVGQKAREDVDYEQAENHDDCILLRHHLPILNSRESPLRTI